MATINAKTLPPRTWTSWQSRGQTALLVEQAAGERTESARAKLGRDSIKETEGQSQLATNSKWGKRRNVKDDEGIDARNGDSILTGVYPEGERAIKTRNAKKQRKDVER